MDPYLEVLLLLAWIGIVSFTLYLAIEKSLVWGFILAVILLVLPLGALNKKEKEAKAMQPQATHTCTCSCTPRGQESDSP